MSDKDTQAQAPGASSIDPNESSTSGLDIAFAKMLRDLPVFNGLNADELDTVSSLFHRKLIKPDEVLFDREDPGAEAYVIMRGCIRVSLLSGKPLGKFESGQILGELAFLDGMARGATAAATEPSILLVIKRDEFEAMAEKHPNIGRLVYKNIACELTKRLRRMNTALESALGSWETAMFRRSDCD